MIDRRQLIHILGAGAVCGALASGAPMGESRFFTTEEQRAVDRLCELLIPADPSGPGAREARGLGLLLAASGGPAATVRRAPPGSTPELIGRAARPHESCCCAWGDPALGHRPSWASSSFDGLSATQVT